VGGVGVRVIQDLASLYLGELGRDERHVPSSCP
jgi:hypothetical protein